jgi:hypothetical protein
MASSLESYTMTMKWHYRTISTYREIPPKWKIGGEDDDKRSPAERYLAVVDRSLEAARDRLPHAAAGDIASLVFSNQALGHEIRSRQQANTIEQRRELAARHLRDMQWRLDQLWERKPLRPRGPGFYDDHTLTEVERQILDLEKQKRALELALWKDTHELGAELVEERSEQAVTQRRFRYLAGGYDDSA